MYAVCFCIRPNISNLVLVDLDNFLSQYDILLKLQLPAASPGNLWPCETLGCYWKLRLLWDSR